MGPVRQTERHIDRRNVGMEVGPGWVGHRGGRGREEERWDLKTGLNEKEKNGT